MDPFIPIFKQYGYPISHKRYFMLGIVLYHHINKIINFESIYLWRSRNR